MRWGYKERRKLAADEKAKGHNMGEGQNGGWQDQKSGRRRPPLKMAAVLETPGVPKVKHVALSPILLSKMVGEHGNIQKT